MTKKHTFWNILLWLIIFIIGSLIVTFLVSPYSFQTFKSNIKSIMPHSNSQEVVTPTSNSTGVISNTQNKEDELITSCKQSFNLCIDITQTKYDDASISLVKIGKFTDINSSIEFYNTWKGSMQMPNWQGGEGNIINSLGLSYNPYAYPQPDNINDVLPFVLLVVKVSRTAEGGKISGVSVIACDKDGKLTETSKRMLEC